MQNHSLFIVIEGLDGSGKTTVARQLAYFLQNVLSKKVKLTFEPNDASCAGLYIRKVLEKKITNFSHETLALAFAANRRDHGDRVVSKWLEEGSDKVVICDRYYLSSLVYQSNDNFSMAEVMRLNANARKPDLIFFMNVSNEVVQQRMDIRNKPKELFEENLSQTRNKFLRGIDFLRTERAENIFEIDANGTIPSVLSQMAKVIYDLHPEWQDERLLNIEEYPLKAAFSFEKTGSFDGTIKKLLLPTTDRNNTSTNQEKIKINFSKLSFNEKGSLFLNHLSEINYEVGDQIAGTTSTVFSLSYPIPGGLIQRGAALLVDEEQRYDSILSTVSEIKQLLDFIFVFIPGPEDSITEHFEREVIVRKNNLSGLFPNIKIISASDLQKIALDYLSR
ncbi:MAG: dTMP kinase [Saprospiraceae bacterium]